MKTSKLLSALLMTAALSLLSCQSNEPTVSVTNENQETDAALKVITQNDAIIKSIRRPDTSVKIQSLSNEEGAGLLLMREEEKLAHDVYVYFNNLYAHRVFSNISKSEAQHTEAVLRLINYYGLTDPASTEEGVFSDSSIQDLYNNLISQGTTLEAALATGAYIEEYDIKDLQKLLETTENAYIKRVYTNLLRGSINHLKAFTRILRAKGITYSPTILSQDEYNAIISK